LQGRLLVMLTKLCSAKTVLEIGTFTGYSALCFAEGGAKTVTTLEIDPAAAAVAARYFAQAGELGEGIDLRLGAPALEQMAELQPEEPYDLVFMDADKRKVRACVGCGGGGDVYVRKEMREYEIRRGGDILVKVLGNA